MATFSFRRAPEWAPRRLGRVGWIFVLLLLLALGLRLPEALASWRGDRLLAQAERFYRADEMASAAAHYERLVEHGERRHDDASKVHGWIGWSAALTASGGDLDAAERHLNAALALARRLRDPVLEGDSLTALGVYYWYFRRRRQRSMETFYRPALNLYRQAGHRRGEASVRARMALIHLRDADYEAAAEHLQASLDIYQSLGDVFGLSDVHRYLGVLSGQLERYDLAHEHYAKSLEYCRDHDYALGCRNLDSMLAHLYMRRGEFKRSIDILDRWIDDTNVPLATRRRHWVTRGNAWLHLGDARQAASSYRQALALQASELDDDPAFRASTLTMLAHAHMQDGELDAADDALRGAEEVPIAAKGWSLTVLHTLARADWADLRGDRRAALNHLLSAAEIESQTFGSARSLFFQTQYRQVFERLFSLLFADVVSQDAAEELTFRFLEQMRYRAFRSILVRLEETEVEPRQAGPRQAGPRQAGPDVDGRDGQLLQRLEALSRRYAEEPTPALWDALRQAYGAYEDNLLRRELVASRYRQLAARRPIELAALQRSLDADEALVEYVISGERVFALVITPGSLDSAVLPVTAAQLEAKIKLFGRRLFGEPRVTDDWRPLAAELGRVVWTPLTATGALRGVRRLTWVPMGFLHALPLAAVMDAEGRLLGPTYAVSRSLSASARAGAAAAGSGRPAPSLPMLAMGLRRSPVGELPELAFAESEAQAVADHFAVTPWLSEAASEATFKRLAPTARRLHVATHGLVEERLPLHARLRLAAGDGDDGELTVREIIDLRLAAELVTLSACGTGLTSVPSGLADLEVDRLGFVEAFLHAGASHVLATLMPVSDRGTAAFMDQFYNYAKSMPPADALAAARRRVMESESAQVAGLPMDHPRYWAPFILVSGGGGSRQPEPVVTPTLAGRTPSNPAPP